MRARNMAAVVAVATLLIADVAGASFKLEAGDAAFALKASARMQGRFEYEEPETGGNATAFSIPRARLTLSGHAHTTKLDYKLQTDFGKGFVSLKDFYLDYTLVDGWVQVRAGQYKRPFSRQQLTSSSKLEFVDRAITDKAFGAGRDIGVMVHNGKAGAQYAVGVFNGTGDKPSFAGDVLVDTTTGEGEVGRGQFSNVPGQVHPMVVVRGGYSFGGINGYSEADLEGGPLRFAVGASVVLDFDASGADGGAVLGEADFIVKVIGVSLTGAVYVAQVQDGESFTDLTAGATGFHVQLGYLVLGRFQPAIRYASVMPDGDDNGTSEAAAGLTVYFYGHKVKWQTDFALLNSQDAMARDQTDNRLRTQVQFAF